MEKGNIDVWDILLLAVALAIIFWALLKAFGVIHSPVWVEMIPYFGLGFAIIGAVYKSGKIIRGIEETDKKVNRILRFEERFSRIEHEHNLAMQGKLNLH